MRRRLYCGVGGLAMAMISVAATATAPMPQNVPFLRSLVSSGQVSEALGQVQAGLEQNPRDAQLLSLWGEILFRQSNFERADEVYRLALSADAHCARAHWGLGRLAALGTRQDEAKKYFSAAFQNDPRDPDLILSFADFVEDAEGRAILYRNFLALSNPGDTIRRENVAAKLEIAERIGQRPVAKRVSPYQPYHFKLARFSAPSLTAKGLLMEARINGGKPLRLLLDTGASGIYLRARSARNAKLEVLTESRIGGLGSERPDNGHLALARSLLIGEFRLENFPVQTLALDHLPEADGVIGTDVFKDFVVRLDSRAKTLDLTPYAQETRPPVSNAYRLGHYLLLPALANGRQQGVFVVDTGASFSLVASHVSPRRIPGDGPVDLNGVRGAMDGVVRSGSLSVTIENTRWVDTDSVSTDLSEMSRQTGVEISGILGYPLLRQSILIINYRDGSVALRPHSQ